MSDDPEQTIIAPRAANARIGTRLNGIYEIESLIAVGGMGEVYKGRAIQTGDAVAIKMIRPDMARDEAVLALFRREAAALHNLYNEAIVRYYVFAIDPVTATPYLAMEFVDGQPLSERIRDRPLTVDEVDILRRRVAPGLHAAHRLGIIHRDISPDNIILPFGDPARAKIIDFGIARSSILGEGTVIGSGFAGKYNYVSPEQLGLFGADVTGRSDMYAFALVLAEAATGRAIDMGGSQADILDKRRRLPDLSQVDPRLRPLLAQMLSPDPAGRPADMADVAAWQLPAEGKAAAAKSGGAKGGTEVAGRSPSGIVAALLALAVLGAGAFYGWSMMSSPPVTGPSRSGKTSPPLLEPDANDGPTIADPPVLNERIGAPNETQQPAQQPVDGDKSAAAQQQSPLGRPSQTSPPKDRPPADQQRPPSIDNGLQNPATASAKQPGTIVREPEATTPIARIERYVRDYDGGPCFVLWPLEIGERKALLEGYGDNTDPFRIFDAAFKAAQGFEAEIGLRRLTTAQCPMANFLRQPGVAIDRSPMLKIGAFNMKSGEVLSGTVEAGGGRNLDVVLIGDDGLVYNLASFMKRDGGNVGFSLKLESSGGAARAQTVLALVSREPLPTLSGPSPAPAAEFFANLKRDLARQDGPLGLAVKYFRIE